MKPMTVDEALAHAKIHAVPGGAQYVLANEVRRQRGELNIARDDLQSWIDSRNDWMARAYAAEAELKAARIDEDCLKCSNRGKTNGLSQESFCDSCIYQGRSWRVNHFSGFSAITQSPAVKYMGRRMSPDGTKECWGFDIGDELPEGTLLYTRPIPAPAPAPAVPAPLPSDSVRAEFEKLLPQLANPEKWTVGERANYFGFFCHGWYGRVGEAAYQAAEPDRFSTKDSGV